MDMSWGQMTDEIQHDGIGAGKDLWHKIQMTAYITEKQEAFAKRDFYLVVLYRRNKATNTGDCLVWPRMSCPTPVYNQHVFKYRHDSKNIEYLWSIPTEHKYLYYIKHAKNLMLDPIHFQQVQFCQLMESGQLLDWVKKENGETGKEPNLVMRPKAVSA